MILSYLSVMCFATALGLYVKYTQPRHKLATLTALSVSSLSYGASGFDVKTILGNATIKGYWPIVSAVIIVVIIASIISTLFKVFVKNSGELDIGDLFTKLAIGGILAATTDWSQVFKA